MIIRIDVECKLGHRKNNIFVTSGEPLGPCLYEAVLDGENAGDCGLALEQVFDNRAETEGYWVMRGVNW